MYNINIYFASTDKIYMESIERYILNNCKNLNVTFFSNVKRLEEGLSNIKHKIDIVLVDEETYEYLSEKEKVKILIILVEDETSIKQADINKISKYQSGEKLIARIQDIYKEAHSDRMHEVSEAVTKTKLIGVYSPIGGVGKTTIAAMCSIIASHLGKRVLYLNLENIASTSAYFRSNYHENISRLVYFLRNKSRDIVQQKMATLWSVDSKYRVYFFAPPDNMSDLDELGKSEIEKLFTALKLSEHFDYIFVDLPSILDKNKQTILSKLDKIFLVIGNDEISAVKIELFSRDMEVILGKESILEKTTIVINRFDQEYRPASKDRLGAREVSFYLPHEPSLKYYSYSQFEVNNDNKFQAAVTKLVNSI